MTPEEAYKKGFEDGAEYWHTDVTETLPEWNATDVDQVGKEADRRWKGMEPNQPQCAQCGKVVISSRLGKDGRYGDVCTCPNPMYGPAGNWEHEHIHWHHRDAPNPLSHKELHSHGPDGDHHPRSEHEGN